MQTPRHKVLIAHIAISATILLVLLSIMVTFWFPKGLFGVGGGWDGLKILLPIDMVLGPTLTFMFYKPGKKSAVFDLTAIACVQAIALSYGIYAVYSQHPTALVLSDGKLNTLTPVAFKEARTWLEQEEMEVIHPSDLDDNHPPVVVSKSFNAETFGPYLESVMNGGVEQMQRADRYQSLETGAAELAKAALSTEAATKNLGFEANSKHVYFSVRSTHHNGVAEFSATGEELIYVHPLVVTPPPTEAE